MSTLTISNGYRVPLLGLGRNRAMQHLSQKRITKAVREELRRHYGLSNVEVCCAAKLTSDGWRGSCKIYQEDFTFKIAG
jgi:hypothetical protein